MRKMNAAPRYRVISLRITDQEFEVIGALKNEETPNVSEILRMALNRLLEETGEGHGIICHEKG